MNCQTLSAVFILLALSARAFGGVPLRSVAEALSITAEETDGPVPFDLTGTALGYSHNTFFLRDGSSGIVLENKQTNRVVWTAGDLIRVRGDMTVRADERRFARVRQVKILAHRTLPPPSAATGGEILNGSRNFQFVTIEGVPQSILTDDLDQDYSWFALRTPKGIVMCVTGTNIFNLVELRRLIDAEISLTGLARPSTGWRYGFAPCLGFSSTNALKILRPAPTDPFATDRQFQSSALHRQTLSGLVLSATASRCHLRTATGRFVEADALDGVSLPAPGSTVTVAGFPELDGKRLKLTEAVFRTETNHPAVRTEPPRSLRFDQLFTRADVVGVNTEIHGTLVTLTGSVRSRNADPNSGWSFELVSGSKRVTVDCSAFAMNPIVPDATILKVAGIMLTEFEPVQTSVAFPVFRDFRLVPRGQADLVIIKRTPWWTPVRLLMVLVILLLTLVGVLWWNRTLNVRANRRGEELAREQLAHRAVALKIEERTRLAVEIHDAISQTLTGIALLFDSAEDDAATPSLRRFFTVARQMLASCRQELKACLWDLRTRTFEERDMTETLRRALQPYANEAKIQIRFNVSRESLTESQTHDILRIVRELVINALRHGHAKTVVIAGTREGGTIRFAVEDDGIGFDPNFTPGPMDGHFGLQGIRERLRTHCGTFDLTPARPHGTRARVTLSLEESENGEE